MGCILDGCKQTASENQLRCRCNIVQQNNAKIQYLNSSLLLFGKK